MLNLLAQGPSSKAWRVAVWSEWSLSAVAECESGESRLAWRGAEPLRAERERVMSVATPSRRLTF